MTTHGCDLYHGNAMVNPDDYDFVIHKATQGTSFVDPMCGKRITQVRDAGKVVGMYHFLVPGDPVLPQVVFFIHAARPFAGDILALDFEDDGTWRNYSQSELAAIASSWMIYASQMAPRNRVILYCDQFVRQTIVTPYSVNIGDGLWVADYGREPQQQWVIWQSTDSPIDTDQGNFGDLAAMREWAAKGINQQRHDEQYQLLQ